MSTVSVIYDLIGRDRASAAFDSAGRSAGRLETSVRRAGMAVAAAGGVIAAGAVAIAAESVKAGAEFQASMEKIHTQAGASQKDVDSLTASVLKLAPSAQQGPQALSEALFHLKSVGMDNADAMMALKTASDLAAVGGADLESTTNALAGAWRSGIKGAETFSKTAATVNAIIGAGNMKMEDLTAAISTGILPAAKTFGVSLGSVGAALALMTDEGVPAEEAATRLRMTLSLIGAPSKEAAGWLAKIGITGTMLADAMRGPQGIIGAVTLLHDHLDKSGLSASQAAALISNAFGGGRSSSAIMTMLNNLEVLRKKQQQINDTTGNYGGAVAAQRKTASAQFALLRSDVDTLGIRLGLDLLPPVTAFVGWLAKTGVPGVEAFAGKVASMLPVKQVEDGAKKIIDVISNFLGIGAKPKAVPVTYRLSQMTGTMTSAHGVSLGAGLASSASSSLGGALAAGIGKINWGNIGKTLGKGLGSAITLGLAGAGGLAQRLVDALGKLDWTEIGKKVGGNAIGFALGFLANLGADLFSPSFWKKHWWDVILGVLSVTGAGKIGGLLARIVEHVPVLRIFAPMLRGLERLTGPVNNAIGKVVRAVGRGLLDGFTKVFPAAGSFLEREGGLLGIRLGVAGLRVGEAAVRLAEGVGNGILAGARGLGSIIGRVIGWILLPFAKSGGWLLGKGTDVMSGLLRGLAARWPAVIGWVRRIFGWILGPFADAGSWLLRKGGDIILGLYRGSAAAWRTMWSWVTRIYGWVTGYFARARKWLLGAGKDVIQGLWDGLTFIWRKVAGWIGGLAGWIKAHKGPLSLDRKLLVPAGRALMEGLGIGLLGGFVKVKDIISGAAGTVASGFKELGRLGLSGLKAVGGAFSSAWHAIFGGGGGGGDTGAHGAAAAFAQSVARTLIGAYGWGSGQMTPLIKLWNQESGWNAYAVNPSSGAYGIPQALGKGHPYALGDVFTQILWGLNYIHGRYGSPAAAWAHEQAFNWYGYGGPFRAHQLIGVGDRGPELVAFSQPGRVFSPEQSAALIAGARDDGGNTYHITVNVPPTASKADTGRAVVDCIRAYEQGSGKGWRK